MGMLEELEKMEELLGLSYRQKICLEKLRSLEEAKNYYDCQIHEDKEKEITYFNPHYRREYFKEERTVWGHHEDGLTYDYSDRFRSWNGKKHDQAWEHANAFAKMRTAKWVEAYLSFFFDKDIEIVHIKASFDRSSGHSFQVFGYRERKA